MPVDPWSQSGHAVRFDWGPTGATRADGGGVLVVVDVLSFTTAGLVVVERGGVVHPAAWRVDRAQTLTAELGAVLAVDRREVTADHPWSLSPSALRAAPVPPALVLPSPNGSAVAAVAGGVVIAACLRNARAVCAWLHRTATAPVTAVAAGERWPVGSLRPALEDLLGARAVLAALAERGPDLCRRRPRRPPPHTAVRRPWPTRLAGARPDWS